MEHSKQNTSTLQTEKRTASPRDPELPASGGSVLGKQNFSLKGHSPSRRQNVASAPPCAAREAGKQVLGI